MRALTPFLLNTVECNNHSHSMRAQQIHHSNDDRHCDSRSAIDADVHNNKDDGGKQQRKTMQQQHSSAAIRNIGFETIQSSNDSDERSSGTLSSLGKDNPSGRQWRAGFGGTIRKPRDLRGDIKQTERPSGRL